MSSLKTMTSGVSAETPGREDGGGRGGVPDEEEEEEEAEDDLL